jgi:hypothetical protein
LATKSWNPDGFTDTQCATKPTRIEAMQAANDKATNRMFSYIGKKIDDAMIKLNKEQDKFDKEDTRPPPYFLDCSICK